MYELLATVELGIMHMADSIPSLATESVFGSSNKLRGSLWFSIFKQLACMETRCLGTENYLCPCRLSVTDYLPHDNRNLQNK